MHLYYTFVHNFYTQKKKNYIQCIFLTIMAHRVEQTIDIATKHVHNN